VPYIKHAIIVLSNSLETKLIQSVDVHYWYV